MSAGTVPNGFRDDSELAGQMQSFAGRFLDGSRPVDPAQVVAEAAEALPGAVAAGLTLVSGSKPPRTVAATDPLVEQVDAIQYDAGEGPCLEAIKDNDLTVADDLAADDRWPRFAARAVAETPVRCMMGVRIFLGGEDRGSLNLYATEPGVFTPLDQAVAAIFGTLSSLSLQHALEQRKAQNLLAALESSRQIGMAMGILMSRKLITADEAFEQLRRASQHLHRRVREIAEEVAETGQLPPLPPHLA